jgi:hypothetical protein
VSTDIRLATSYLAAFDIENRLSDGESYLPPCVVIVWVIGRRCAGSVCKVGPLPGRCALSHHVTQCTVSRPKDLLAGDGEGRAERFAYVVLAHKNPAAVARLTRAVRRGSPSADVLVAWNGRLPASGLALLHAAGARRVGSGRPVRWGSFSLVDRVFEAFEAARGYDWVVLISGEDHPVLPLRAWEDAVRSRGVDAVLAAVPMNPDDAELASRIAFRWWVCQFRRPFLILVPVLRRVVPPALRPRVVVFERHCLVAYRRVAPPTGVWKGATWLAVSGRMLEHLLAAAPAARQAFGRTLCPDECCLQTLVAGSGLSVLAADVTYTRWSFPEAAHPDELGPEDLDEITRAGAPFARKLSGDRGERLRDLLDERLERGAEQVASADPPLDPTGSAGPVGDPDPAAEVDGPMLGGR